MYNVRSIDREATIDREAVTGTKVESCLELASWRLDEDGGLEGGEGVLEGHHVSFLVLHRECHHRHIDASLADLISKGVCTE